MAILENILTQIDELMPNAYDFDAKLRWFNECESIVKTKAMREYGLINTDCTTLVNMPHNIGALDIIKVFIDDVEVSINDYRTNGFSSDDTSKNVSIVYLIPHEDISILKYTGTFSVLDGNITIPNHEFVAGDTIDVLIDTDTVRVCILGTSGETVYIGDALSNGEVGDITLALVYKTAAPPPYDKIYTYYIGAQMDYYSKDYESYNFNIQNFNIVLEQLSNYAGQHSATPPPSKLKNIW